MPSLPWYKKFGTPGMLVVRGRAHSALSVCVCVCVFACAQTCVRACVRACAWQGVFIFNMWMKNKMAKGRAKTTAGAAGAAAAGAGAAAAEAKKDN
jgi:hypothetical protein